MQLIIVLVFLLTAVPDLAWTQQQPSPTREAAALVHAQQSAPATNILCIDLATAVLYVGTGNSCD